MLKVNIKETDLKAEGPLTRRSITDMIVIHHTGGADLDASAEQIDGWHKGQGWAMIGYHFVVRKDGTIERGRPEWAVGSHAYGENYHTLGIHVCGTFEGPVEPTKEQIEMTAMLIAYLSEKYNIACDHSHIVGHCDLMSTDCPGKNLYGKLAVIIGKANWYRYGPQPDAIVKEVIRIKSGSPIEEGIKAKIRELLGNAEVVFEV